MGGEDCSRFGAEEYNDGKSSNGEGSLKIIQWCCGGQRPLD